VNDKKIGVASTNSLEESSIRDTLEKALKIASFQQPDPDFESLPKPKEIPKVTSEVYFATEKQMAEGVNTVIQKAKSKDLIASGAYANGASEIAIANSHGVFAYHTGSSCNLSTIVLGKTSSGFAADVARKVEDIDAQKVADVAVGKTLESADPTDVEPGEYEVILEPQAVAEMIAFFQWYGPNARIYHEQASPLSGKMGVKVFSNNITLIDDPFHPEVFPMPFDYEGYPKKKLTIIEKGVLKNIAYDSYTAAKYKAEKRVDFPTLGSPTIPIESAIRALVCLKRRYLSGAAAYPHGRLCESTFLLS
jgi:predicted Zn-dependent protease